MLSGKVALVTGGGSGIGRATCQVLAREGARVVILDVNATMAQKTFQSLPEGSHSVYTVDITDVKILESAVKSVIEKYKEPPTIVANCAAIHIPFNPPMQIKSEEFDRIIAVNLKGTINVIQIIYKELTERKIAGSIINIGSVARNYKVAKNASYIATKAAIHKLTKAYAEEMGQHGIRCNVVHPGMIQTPLLLDNTTEEYREILIAQTALRRIGKPEEVAEVIAFLASDKSSYVTGSAINVSGGLL